MSCGELAGQRGSIMNKSYIFSKLYVRQHFPEAVIVIGVVMYHCYDKKTGQRLCIPQSSPEKAWIKAAAFVRAAI